MILRLHAEWLKAPRLVLGAIALLTSVFALGNAAIAQSQAASQLTASAAQHSTRAFAAEAHERAALAALLQSPDGSFVFHAGLFSTMPGFVLVGLIAATVIGREWDRGTATAMFLADPSLWRTVWAKTLAVWCASLGLYALVSLVTGVVGATVGAAWWPLDPAADAPLTRLLLTPLVLFAYSLGLSTVALVVRTWLRTIGTTVLLAALISTFSAFPGVAPWAPFGLVLELGEFTYQHGVWDHWVHVSPTRVNHYAELDHAGPWQAHVGFVVVATALVVRWTIRRRKSAGVLS